VHQHLLDADGVAVQVVDLEVVDGFAGWPCLTRSDGREALFFQEKNVADLEVAGIDPAAGDARFGGGGGNMIRLGPSGQRAAFDHPEGVPRGRGNGFSGDFDNDEIAFVARLVAFQHRTQLPGFGGMIESPDSFADADILNGPQALLGRNGRPRGEALDASRPTGTQARKVLGPVVGRYGEASITTIVDCLHFIAFGVDVIWRKEFVTVPRAARAPRAAPTVVASESSIGASPAAKCFFAPATSETASSEAAAGAKPSANWTQPSWS
jgi:hypothetical protein